jgi:HAE1 family hydrophobic/amphiphilic exporter-1
LSISEIAVARPVFTGMLALLLVVLGVLGLQRLGTDLYPEVSFPVVTVNVVYRGAGPSEIETQVVKPIEDAVAGISGLDIIHSWSRENLATVAVQFALSTNLDRAVQDVRDKVAGVAGRLPKGADAPIVGRVDLSAQPVLTYAASGQETTSAKLRKLLDEKLRPSLAQIQGVAEVRIVGGDVREIHVDLDLDRTRAAGLSPADVATRIGAENLNLPAGRLTLGAKELTIRSVGEFADVDALRGLPVARSATGAQVRLDEIATVTDSIAERRTLARLNGREAIIVEIVKQPGSNTVDVADQVKAKIAREAPSLGHGFSATLLIDQSRLIRENAREVWVALVFGGAMAILIILAFLLDPRGTFISALALPTSVIGTFFVMYLFGYTLNQMTLLAMSLAIGLLIDDAVVVREAITHRLDQGEEPAHAAVHGTRDVGLAVLATTFTLVAVFVPVAFMPGIVGQFFKQFGITISAAVLISLFISFTLDPMLSARLVRRRLPGEELHGAVGRALLGALDRIERAYTRILGWALDHKLVTGALSVAALSLSLWSARGLAGEFLAPEDHGQFIVDLKLAPSASLEETTARTARAEEALAKIPEVTDTYAIVGTSGDVNKARLRVLVTDKSKRTRSLSELREQGRRLVTDAVPWAQITLSSPPILEGLGDYYPMMLRVVGPDLAQVRGRAEAVAAILRALPGTADVRIDDAPPKPELQIAVDRTRASDVDLPASAVAAQLRLAIDGDVAAKLREGTDETDIRVRLRAADRGTVERLRALELFTPHGPRQVPDVAAVSLRDGPAVIEHENRERQIAVYSDLAPGAALGEVGKALKSRVSALDMPPGYAVIYDGQIKSFKEQNDAFATAFALAFVFIFMVLASQFESLKHPLTIMVSLPLALVGAFLALLATGHHLSLGAMIGVILLMGLVTKNAILLVDGALAHVRAGDDPRTALMKAGPRRLRPILMTSAAMAVGMLPTALGTGLGSEFRAPMAIAVIGGVITSTLLTLLVVPVVFAGMERVTFRRRVAITSPASA